MVNYFSLSKSNIFYYDLEKKTIARFPTKSNLFPHGSDNSLYFGMTTNSLVCDIFCKLFDVDDIMQLCNRSYDMRCGIDDVKVVLNINAQNQIQIKITKDGTMYRLTSNYAFEEMRNIDFTKMLIVVDFKNNIIRFKNPEELNL